MDRDGPPSTTRPNANGANSSVQLQVKHEGRKPLFTAPARDENNKNSILPRPTTARIPSGGSNDGFGFGNGFGRKAMSDPHGALSERRDSNGSLSSPAGTRIPRPSSAASISTRRKPISLTEAYRLAEGEEMEQPDRHNPVDGSPSPAPRLARAKGGVDETRLRHMLNQDHLDTKGRNSRPSQFPRRATEGDGHDGGRAELARVASNRVSDWRTRAPTRAELLNPSESPKSDARNGGSLPDLVPGIEDVPFPSVESPARGPERITRFDYANRSPEKSFAWQVDEDFTAGDLQISNSPRIRVDSRPFASRPSLLDDSSRKPYHAGFQNTKLDEIRARELQAESNLPIVQPRPRPSPRSRNNRLDEIRAREAEAAQKIPIPDRNLPRPRNTKLDDIQQREADGISKRAFAAARLQEIKEQNSMSRSLSPEESRPWSSRHVAGEPPYLSGRATRIPIRPRSAFEVGGERIPDTPVTIFKARRDLDGAPVELPGFKRPPGNAVSTSLDTAHTRADSRELLRRLARAASSSPAAEPEARPPLSPAKAEQNLNDKPLLKSLILGRASDNEKKPTLRETRDNGSNGNLRPTVGFAGLRRSGSSESAKSKRSSMHSEPDPTDRIEAEAKLFAPADNHSERGSVRAPSPLVDSNDDEAIEATPRPLKPDPLTMPTPKITGAYVETPATVRVEHRSDSEGEKAQQPKLERPASPVTFPDKTTSLAWKNGQRDTASKPAVAVKEAEAAVTTSAAVRRKPRAQSLPRRRPPLKNSAKPHSVKDDLLELQRSHNIEDSTLDDLEDIITGRKPASSKVDAFLKDLPANIGGEERNFSQKQRSPRKSPQKLSKMKEVIKAEDLSDLSDLSDEELAAYDRMSRSLQTGLLGIRTAKEGIQRLESRFSQAGGKLDVKSAKPADGHQHESPEKGCHICPEGPKAQTVAYVHLPLPRLYHWVPQFRFTFLGLVLFLASLWYAAESTMCAAYCRPITCASTPCVWSYDDPTFGSAIPVKLDQWATGGHGRTLAAFAVEEAQDWIADMLDLAYGRDITDVAVEQLSPEQKRRHRRRLRKKRLGKSTPGPQPDEQAKWDAWRRTRRAKERAREVREMGYLASSYETEEGSIGGDERIW